ncbi:hypothetical protein PQX77_002822 [Marasmius sp. AFHP31]|nr:hypothetical protein PQX77_002822 [Marasmius sp. AFHP31]
MFLSEPQDVGMALARKTTPRLHRCLPQAKGFVFSTPGDQVTQDEFQDWYNNDTCPTSIRQPRLFSLWGEVSRFQPSDPSHHRLGGAGRDNIPKDGEWTGVWVERRKSNTRDRDTNLRLIQ